MKAVKLKKAWLKDAETLLRAVGAVHGKRAFPSEVYLSKEDYKVLKQNTAKAFKKKYPFILAKKLDFSIGMHLLNLGPNESLGSALKPGVALVDEVRIQEEVALNDEEVKESGAKKK
jgi:spore germination protein GerM